MKSLRVMYFNKCGLSKVMFFHVNNTKEIIITVKSRLFSTKLLYYCII